LQLRSQDENSIVRISLSEAVCVTLVTDNAAGAQTERPGAARPVSVVLGSANSPAAFSLLLSCSYGRRRFVAAAAL
jgi:hypothetical protein